MTYQQQITLTRLAAQIGRLVTDINRYDAKLEAMLADRQGLSYPAACGTAKGGLTILRIEAEHLMRIVDQLGEM